MQRRREGESENGRPEREFEGGRDGWTDKQKETDTHTHTHTHTHAQHLNAALLARLTERPPPHHIDGAAGYCATSLQVRVPSPR